MMKCPSKFLLNDQSTYDGNNMENTSFEMQDERPVDVSTGDGGHHSSGHFSNDNSLSSSQKRGRGRPPGSKNRYSELGDPNEIIYNQSTARFRSREKPSGFKNKSGQQEQVSSECINQRSHHCKDDNFLTSSRKRGRGRPRGSTNKSRCSAADDEDYDVGNRLQSPKVDKFSVTFKEGKGHETLNSSIIKRSRGRPSLAKKTERTTHANNINSETSERLEIIESSNQEETSDKQGQTNLSNEGSTEFREKKRGRGRPRGSLNKKGRKGFQNEVTYYYKVNLTARQKVLKDKRSKGRPPGSQNKQKSVKLFPKKIAKNFEKRIFKRMEMANQDTTTTKSNYQPTNIRKIPEHRLTEAITMLSNSEHPIWEDRNTSCNKSIHRHWGEYTLSNHNLRLKFARQFLLRRDWANLSKVLSIASQDLSFQYIYYPLLAKYASLCLAHTNKQQFNKFVQFLVRTEDGGKVLKKCTNVQFSENYSEDDNEE